MRLVHISLHRRDSGAPDGFKPCRISQVPRSEIRGMADFEGPRHGLKMPAGAPRRPCGGACGSRFYSVHCVANPATAGVAAFEWRAPTAAQLRLQCLSPDAFRWDQNWVGDWVRVGSVSVSASETGSGTLSGSGLGSGSWSGSCRFSVWGFDQVGKELAQLSLSCVTQDACRWALHRLPHPVGYLDACTTENNLLDGGTRCGECRDELRADIILRRGCGAEALHIQWRGPRHDVAQLEAGQHYIVCAQPPQRFAPPTRDRFALLLRLLRLQHRFAPSGDRRSAW